MAATEHRDEPGLGSGGCELEESVEQRQRLALAQRWQQQLGTRGGGAGGHQVSERGKPLGRAPGEAAAHRLRQEVVGDARVRWGRRAGRRRAAAATRALGGRGCGFGGGALATALAALARRLVGGLVGRALRRAGGDVEVGTERGLKGLRRVVRREEADERLSLGRRLSRRVFTPCAQLGAAEQ